VNVQGSCQGWEMKSGPKGKGILQMSFFVFFLVLFFIVCIIIFSYCDGWKPQSKVIGEACKW
jgi:hypothetical protein